jgi:cytochrome c oxidase subunit 4
MSSPASTPTAHAEQGSHSSNGGSHGHVPHILPLKIYLGIGATLLVLTAITVAVAQFDFGSWNLVVAMAIATIKATLVALFFMHLKYDNKLYLTLFLASLLILAIFITLTMFDTLRRGETDERRGTVIQEKATMYDKLKPAKPEPKKSGEPAPPTAEPAHK